jgi:aspartate/glutamate racemase
MKRPGVPDTRITMLQGIYEEKFKNAMEEDKERASLFFRPKLGYI